MLSKNAGPYTRIYGPAIRKALLVALDLVYMTLKGSENYEYAKFMNM